MFFKQFLRILKANLLSLGWIGLSLTISAFTIAVVISGAFVIRLFFKDVLQVDSPLLGGFSLMLSFVIYLGTVGWFAWRWLRRKLQI